MCGLAERLFPGQPWVDRARASLARGPGSAAQALAAASRQVRGLLDAGDEEAAEQFLRQTVAAFQHENQPLNELAWLLHRRKKWAEALPVAQELRQRRPDDITGYTIAAACHRHLGDLDRAEHVLALAAQGFPEQAWMLRARAEIAEANGQPEKALAHARGLVEKEADETGYKLVIRLLRRLGRSEDVRKTLENCHETLPNAVWPVAELTQLAASAEKWAEAATLASRLRAMSPEEPSGYAIGIKALRNAWRLDEASQLQHAAVTRFPTDMWLHAAGAQIAGDLNDWELEEQLWTNIRVLFPDDWPGYLFGAGALQACRKNTEAEALLDQAIRHFADNEKFYLRRAKLAEYRLEWKAADAHWHAAVQAFPENSDIFLHWATLFSRPPTPSDRHPGLTIKRLRAGLDARPDDLPSHLALIRALMAADRPADAAATCSQAREILPDSVELTFAHAEIQASAGEAAHALLIARAAAVQAPADPNGILIFIRLLLQSGDYDEADRVCEEAIARFPADRNLRRCFAASAERREDFRLAYSRWKLAAAAFPRDLDIRRDFFEARTRLEAVAGIDTPILDPTSRSHEADIALATSFESLGGTGQGCEFGVVQRELGAEPLGLLRWSNILPDQLTAALRERFDGVGDPAQTIVSDTDTREYSARDRRFGMRMHTFLSAEEIPPNKAAKVILLRLSFLRRKFLEGLELHDKIYVYKLWGRTLTQAELDALFDALSSYGPNWLLYVRLADDNYPAGTVELARPRLIIGHITGFSLAADGTPRRADMVCWKKLCKAAKEIRDRSPSFIESATA